MRANFRNASFIIKFRRLTTFAVLELFVGWDSVADIVTRYELEGSGIEFQRGRDFPHASRPALDPTQPPIQWEPRVLPWR